MTESKSRRTYLLRPRVTVPPQKRGLRFRAREMRCAKPRARKTAGKPGLAFQSVQSCASERRLILV